MDLYSNFTYLLEDPDNGDEFRQVVALVVGGDDD